MSKPNQETPDERAKRQVAELLRIKREQGTEAAQAATSKLFLDILKGRAK